MKYKCTVSYIGKHYDGWQSQKNGRSVQEVIEAVIERITHEKTTITSSGRTDAGVNARAQVFMFTSDKNISPYKWMGAMNAFLPEDIHIMHCEEAPSDFHARFQVRRKTYTYRINNGMYNVFNNDYAYYFPYPLDLEKMKECAQVFVGTHDFTSFNSTPLSLYPDQTRTIDEVAVTKDADVISLTFRGKGFLRYQVRMMSAAVIDVGNGKISVDDVRKMLEAKDKKVKRKNAPANGLTLERVEYYEMIAVDNQVQIRGFLPGDQFPEHTTLQELVDKEITHASERMYVICTRTEQETIGYVSVKGTTAEFQLFKEEDLNLLKGVQEQIEKWISTNQYQYTVRVI